jgi:hypothetical protein
MKITPAGDPRQSPRFVVSFFSLPWEFRPPGWRTGTWIKIPPVPVYIRLGRRKNWETEMITPVKPPR